MRKFRLLLLLVMTVPAAVSAYSEEAMKVQCRNEVIELHQFFEDWYAGNIAGTDEVFRRFSGVVAEEFAIISPGGGRMSRDAILTRVRDAHGTHEGESFRVWIENYDGRLLTEGLFLVTYEEWQEQKGLKRGRISTAVFRHSTETRNGVVWLHVHETWLPE